MALAISLDRRGAAGGVLSIRQLFKYVKDAPPVRAQPADLQAYLDRELTKIQQVISETLGVLEITRAAHIVNGISSNWSWSDVIGAPAVGEVKGNAVQLSAITQFEWSHTDGFGRDFADLLGPTDSIGLQAGDVISVFNTSRGIDCLYILDSDSVDMGTYERVAVTYQTGPSGNPATGDVTILEWKPVRNGA